MVCHPPCFQPEKRAPSVPWLCFAAATNLFAPTPPKNGDVYTEEDWNETSGPTDAMNAYSASKVVYATIWGIHCSLPAHVDSCADRPELSIALGTPSSGAGGEGGMGVVQGRER